MRLVLCTIFWFTSWSVWSLFSDGASDDECIIHFNEGANRIWGQANDEFTAIMKNIYRLCGKDPADIQSSHNGFDKPEVTFGDIVCLWFGPHSKIYSIFYEKLHWDYQKFVLFLSTSCQIAYYNLDCNVMYGKILNSKGTNTLRNLDW